MPLLTNFTTWFVCLFIFFFIVFIYLSSSSYEEFTKSVLDDYRLNELRHQIQLSYMLSNKALKTMLHDTPPVYVSNTRQLQGFLSLKKIEQVRLCVEITENKDVQMNLNDSLEEEREENENDCSSKVEVEKHKVGGEDEVGEENEEDDESESRFDMLEDLDGASSEDDNFSLYGESPTQDEDSPTLPPKKRSQNLSRCKGNPEVLRLEMSSLNLAVGQRYMSKDDLERRLKLLSVKDRFDFDVDISTPTLFIVKCWVDGCLWRVRASTQGRSPTFYVRIYDSDYTCFVTERSYRSRQATPDILGELYKDFLGDVGPSIHPTSVRIAITKQFRVKVFTLLRLSYYNDMAE